MLVSTKNSSLFQKWATTIFFNNYEKEKSLMR